MFSKAMPLRVCTIISRTISLLLASNLPVETMPDGTKLSASIDESTGKLTVEAYGSAVSVAELGEQLAWLRPAVRASPLDNDKIAYCVPVIIKDLGSGNMMPHSSIFQPSFEKVNFKINLRWKRLQARD